MPIVMPKSDVEWADHFVAEEERIRNEERAAIGKYLRDRWQYQPATRFDDDGGGHYDPIDDFQYIDFYVVSRIEDGSYPTDPYMPDRPPGETPSSFERNLLDYERMHAERLAKRVALQEDCARLLRSMRGDTLMILHDSLKKIARETE